MPGAGLIETEVEAIEAAPSPLGSQPGLRVRHRRFLIWLWLIMLIEALIFAFIQPVWSRVDEAQHFSFVQYLSDHGSLPVEGKTFVSKQVIDVSVQENQWGWRQNGALSTPAMLDPSRFTTVPAGLNKHDREKWVRRNLWEFSYEAMQPPLYYAINVPVYKALPADPLVKLYGMRVLAALLASAMIPISFFIAREAFPDSRLVTMGTPVVVLLTQGYALNMSQVSNDALAVPVAAVAVLLLLRMVGRGLTWKRSLIAGVVIGAALLAKLTTIFLIPLALAAPALLVIYKREQIRRALHHAFLIVIPPALMLTPWMIHNISLYGDATGDSAARPLLSSFFASPFQSLQTLRLNEILPTFWFGEPVFPFPFWTVAWVAVGTAMAVALVGMLFYLSQGSRSQVPDVQIRIIFLLVALVVGIVGTLLIPFASGIGGVPGRYLYPVLPVGAFFLLFGIDRLLRRERAQFMAELLLVWMIFWESLSLLAYIQNR